MKIGLTELIVIFIVALVVIGPDKLPFYAKKLGEALAQFRKYSDEAAKDIRNNIVEPLEEAQRPLKEAMQPLEDLDKTIRGNVRDVKKSFTDIGKEKKAPEEQKGPEEEKASNVQNVSEQEAEQKERVYGDTESAEMQEASSDIEKQEEQE